MAPAGHERPQGVSYLEGAPVIDELARLGIIVMDLCRPVPFAADDVPSVGSLVGNVLRR